MSDYLRQYGFILVLTSVAIIIPASVLLLSHFASKFRIRPQRPNPFKLDPYECGMETIGGRWVQFNFRYYLYALLFLVFDITAVFIYPWAVDMTSLGWFALGAMMIFILILSLGWVYAWRKGALEWT